jgi:hypothetical protein
VAVRRHPVHGRIALGFVEQQLHRLGHDSLPPPLATQVIAEVDDVRLRPPPAAHPDRAATVAQFDDPGGFTTDVEDFGDDAPRLADVPMRAPRHIARHLRVGRHSLEQEVGIVKCGRAQRDSRTVHHLDVRHGPILHRCRRATDGG